MLTESVIIALVICAAITIIGAKVQSLPVVFVSSIGVLVCAFETYIDSGDLLVMGLLAFAAIAQIALIDGDRNGSRFYLDRNHRRYSAGLHFRR